MLHDCNATMVFLTKYLAFRPRVWCNSDNFPKTEVGPGSRGAGQPVPRTGALC
jgi:hypothetical protein